MKNVKYNVRSLCNAWWLPAHIKILSEALGNVRTEVENSVYSPTQRVSGNLDSWQSVLEAEVMAYEEHR